MSNVIIIMKYILNCDMVYSYIFLANIIISIATAGYGKLFNQCFDDAHLKTHINSKGRKLRMDNKDG